MQSRNALIRSISDEAVNWRRTLHQNPQTMYEESFASGFVTDLLRKWAIPHEQGLGKTGVVATIEGQKCETGRTVAFRADIDALNIQEQTNLPWASQNPGKMHACGHDGHTASILALGRYLQQTRNFHGTVRLIFQPAEEGGRGAERMVADGLLDRFAFDEIYGFHNWPYNPVGQFLVSPGLILANTDVFSIKLQGRGGHAALPSAADDVVLAASHLVTALQTIVSREVDPLKASVLSVTNFNGGTGADNVLPSEVLLSGTVRCFDSEVRKHFESRMDDFTASIAKAFRLQYEFTYRRITDAVFNHAKNVEHSQSAILKLFGPDSLKPQEPMMGGEDFGYFLERRPGSFIFVGQGDSDRTSPHSQGLHTPNYDFNDAIIPQVVEYFAELAETRLTGNSAR